MAIEINGVPATIPMGFAVIEELVEKGGLRRRSVVLTQAEYDALAIKDEAVIYLIVEA